MEGVTIRRDAPITLHAFGDFFQGFERVDAVRRIFGDETEDVLADLKVEFYSSKFGYMGVSDIDGHLIVSAHYLQHGDERELYLDVVHELVHVQQFREGEDLFPEGLRYPDRPTEIEAYRVAVDEARRIGMNDAAIQEYLRVPWMDDEEHARLLGHLGIHPR